MAYVPLLQMVGEELPALDHGALFVVLDNRPAGALLDVWEDQSGIGLVGPPRATSARQDSNSGFHVSSMRTAPSK
jgi:hypothetical protein